AAERAAARRSADPRERGRLEEVSERRGDREVVAFVNSGPVLLGRGDREADLELASLELPGHLEPCPLEDTDHRAVLGHDLGDEAFDADLRRPRRQLLEEP